MILKTIYTSNIPIDCHILKGRLESDGVDAFIYDENIVWVNPFRAVAIGGVKLKVPVDKFNSAKLILDSISNNKLIDRDGVYDISEAMNKEILRQNEILELKSQIRNNATLLDRVEDIRSKILSQAEFENLIAEEREFAGMTKKTFNFSWKEFWAELLDFDGRIFKYLRQKPVDYYLDKELVDLYKISSHDPSTGTCPGCKSENVSFGYAIDYKWDILYLFFSFLLMIPFPLIRKKFHCFDCGNDFKYSIKGSANAR